MEQDSSVLRTASCENFWQFTAVIIVVGYVMCVVPSKAWADYSLGTPTNCQTFLRLADAFAAGGDPIWVRNVNIENAVTAISHSVTLRSASAPCTAGGSGSIELAASAMTRVLEVGPGKATTVVDLVLDGITVSGGNTVGDGGTIYLYPYTTLMFQNGARVTAGMASGRGGCIYADNSQIVMTPGTSVTECHADGDGGGVAIEGAYAASVYHILHGLGTNSAVANGGGAWIDSAQVCLFEANSNTAGVDGGAAYVSSNQGPAWIGTFTMQNSNFASGNGGGVFITGAESTLDAASQLSNNSTFGNGGGIRATNTAVVYLDPGSLVTANNAQGDGGGIHGDGLATITLHAVYDSGAIGDGESGHGVCGDASGAVSIDSNRAGFDTTGTQTSPTRDGGGVYLSSATLDGSNTSFSNNIASDDGGGIAAYGGASVVLDRVDFTNNIATHGNGGGLLTSDSTSTADLVRATFTGNTARLGGGGGAAFVAASATLASSTFTSNTGLLGGGLGLNSGATADVTATDLTSNTAFAGGGIYAGDSSSVTMLTGTISSNTANLGGAIAADAASVTVGDTPPNGCPAGNPCVTMENNVARGLIGHGGAVVLKAANAFVQIRRSLVAGNSADAGGAFWMDRTDHTLYVHNSAIVDNHGNAGGVAAIAAKAGTLAMVQDTVAHNGTGIHLTSSTTATMINSLVIQNINDIVGLATGASMFGDCNGVQSAATQAAIIGTDNVATTQPTASVSISTGEPINTTDIVNRCSTFLAFDLLGFGRPAGFLSDRGAYEQ